MQDLVNWWSSICMLGLDGLGVKVSRMLETGLSMDKDLYLAAHDTVGLI